MKTLRATKNKYGGVTINSEELPTLIAEFAEKLNISLQIWMRKQIKLVWLIVSSEQSDLIPAAVKCGFSFHHCSSMALMLTKPLETNGCVPRYTSHTVGAGAIILF